VSVVTNAVPQPEPDIARTLRLKPDRPPVVRLSRKVLIALGATSSIAIAGAVAWAMASRPAVKPQPELYGGDAKQPPEALGSLPKDYGVPPGVPKLGPPLPGDLGRPILSAGQQATSPLAAVPQTSPTLAVAPSPGPALQQISQERESARTSQLFANKPESPAGQIGGSDLNASALPAGTAAVEAGASGKSSFLDGTVDRRTVSPDRLSAPVSPYVLQAGAVIPAALITGIRSDLPGQVVAQVTEPVFDSVTGERLLIPQGAKLIGIYENQVAFGQSRILLVWTRLILPNGRSIVLERLPGGDSQGYAGLEDTVDRHWGALFGAATLSSFLGIGSELSAGSNDTDLVRALRQAVADTANQVGQQAVGKALNIQPTLTVRPGAPVRVLVTRDLVLEPYRQ
jgi:type IV secretion system protein VirB10